MYTDKIAGSAMESHPDGRRRPFERVTNADAEAGIIPIAIRDDLTVFIKDLPIDLTQQEASKIVKVVKAYAQGDEDE